MSVIAWDGQTLAADTCCAYGNIVRNESKIFFCKEGVWMGCVGNYEDGYKVKEWLEGKEAKPKELKNSTCLIIRKSKIGKPVATLLEEGMQEIPLSSTPFAIGSGKDMAMGAMLAGYNARAAVELVTPYHADLKLPVEFFDIDDDIPF